MEKSNSTICLEETKQSLTSILLNLSTQEEFTSDQIQHLTASFDAIEITSRSDFELLYKFVEALVKPGLVDNFSDEREYGPEDFPNISSSASEAFSELKHILPKLKIKTNVSKHREDILIPIFLLCGTHCKSFPWSNESSVNLSYEICQTMLIYSNASTLKDILCSNNETHFSLFKRILLLMRPSLAKDTWATNPSMCYIFQWLLKQISHPDLVDYFPDVLPPSLMFTDHHWARYKSIGIDCLYHIIDNVPPTELKMCGRADVIYDALFHLMYCKEIDVVCVLYPCILKLLLGLDGTMHCKYQSRRWNRYDDVYSQLIWHMEIEDNLVLRREYSKIAAEFIEVMGITIAKHMKRSLRVFLEYLSISDSPEEISRINSLNALCILIRVAWPRMEDHCKEIMKSIMSLVYDLETDDQSSVKELTLKSIFQHCKECLTLLKLACPEKFQEHLNNLKMLDNNFPGIKILEGF